MDTIDNRHLQTIGDFNCVTDWTVLNETRMSVYFAIFCIFKKNATQKPGKLGFFLKHRLYINFTHLKVLPCFKVYVPFCSHFCTNFLNINCIKTTDIMNNRYSPF